MKNKTTAQLIKEINELKEKNQELQNSLDQIEKQDKTIYRQINSLILWKSSLKVKVNNSCPNKELVGKEGYLTDLFLDGWTVVVYADPNNFNNWTNNEFYRLDANYLDILEWDVQHFEASMKFMGYSQYEGKWLHKDQLAELLKNKI